MSAPLHHPTVRDRVLTYLAQCPDPGSLHAIASAVGASHSAVRQAIAVLEAAGRLEVQPTEHRSGRPNVYRVTDTAVSAR